MLRNRLFTTATSLDLSGIITDETGTGALVFNSSPTLLTPTVDGVATFRGGIISIPSAAVPTSNTVLGSGAGAAMQSGAARNVAIGPSALAAATTATGNISIGQNTLRGVTTATLNTAVGDNSMAFSGSVTGTQNVGVGYQALQGVQTGIFNTAVGARSAEALDTANNVVAVGYQAALLNKSSDITAVGANALDANTTGANNTAVGKDALGANTTGYSNVAIGNNALGSNTVGGAQVAIGHSAAASSNSTGNSLTAVGYAALQGTTTGSDNAAFGYLAANSGNHQSTTCLGHGAAATWSASYQQLTSCTNGVYIGWNARPNSASPNNEIVIGHGALGNGNSTTTIGNSGTTGTFIPAGNLSVQSGVIETVGTSGNGSNKGIFARNSTQSQSVALVPAAGNDGSSFVGTTTNNQLQIRTNLTTRMTVGTDGNVSIANGNLVMSTAGTGIDFSATANSSGTMTSELLSDYEEGTWTPVYGTTGTGFTTMTMDPGTGTATYTKVGRQVTVRAWLQTDNVDATGATGNLLITGLPFTVNSSSWSAGAVGYCRNWASNFPSNVLADQGSTRLYIESRATSNGTTALAVPADLTAGATADRNALMFTCTYFV